ncbi:MMPL family transporter [Pseudactinotalea sp. Z1732]|uniref:MMPL family transporter n=2 Tax=Micrococcales TaxID=85006 RepID=UPI003C7D0415
MATLLYRVGQWSAGRAGRVITAWALLLALAVGGFLMFGGTLAAQFSIPGTETERVNEHLEDQLDSSATGGTVVFHTTGAAKFTGDQREHISSALDQVEQVEQIPEVIDPFEAQQERAAQDAELAEGLAEIEENRPQLLEAQEGLTAGLEQARAVGAPEQEIAAMEAELDEVSAQLVTLEEQSEQLDLAADLAALAEDIRTVSEDESVALATVLFDDDVFSVPEEVKQEVMDVLDAADLPGVQVEYGAEIAASIDGLIGAGEIIGVIGAALVLILVFRALRPAMLPVLASLVGVGVGVGGSMAFSGTVEMTTVTPVLGLMLGLAVGIDYSLFIIYRHRRQVREGMDVRESIGLANGTAGTAVVFAGLTTMIALLALAITGIEFLAVMGVVAAICIVVAVPVAITFTPAVLGLIGSGVWSRKARERAANGAVPTRSTEPMGTLRAVATVVIGVAALAVLAIPATSMRLGLPDGSSEPQDNTQYQAFTITAQAFGEGQNGPLVVTADLHEPVAEDEELQVQLDLATVLAGRADVAAVAPVGTSAGRDFMAFQVIPIEGPSSESTEALVRDLRAASPLVDGTELGVAGLASGNIDISDQLADALPVYVLVVFGLSVVILIGVFRSILVPVLTALGLGLSLFAALGATTAVFQWGWFGEAFGVHTPGPLLNFLPLLLTGVLFGLAMDYQLFMVSGMREAYAHGTPARRAVTAGFHNGRVVVSVAALIMVAVFGGFAFSQITMVRPMGFALAVGVLFDAFVVRMLIIPAAMHLLGRAAWWMPAWLDRISPNMDVEGAALQRTRTRERELADA